LNSYDEKACREEKRSEVSSTSAGNILNPALLVLRSKGYELGFDRTSNEYGGGIWWAERDGNFFTAEDSVTLPSLASIWEDRGEDWQNKDYEPFLFEELQK